MQRIIIGKALLALAVLAPIPNAMAFDASGGEDKIPKFLIVRIPAVGTELKDQTEQEVDATAEVYPLSDITITRRDDGTVDTERLRADVIQMMQSMEPVKLDIQQEPPTELADAFEQAEMQTADDASKPVVAWRGYGPVRGYSAGVVAYNRSAYRGYYPGQTYPYYGYYNYYSKDKRGVAFTYHYGVYRRTPSYHYYGYYRHW